MRGESQLVGVKKLPHENGIMSAERLVKERLPIVVRAPGALARPHAKRTAGAPLGWPIGVQRKRFMVSWPPLGPPAR